jgi:hypothetical protein
MRTQIASRGHRLSQFAENEHGVAGLDDLLRLGFSRSSVKRWAANGRLHRIHRGVYAVGRAELNVYGRWLAAVKACGPGAVLSHRTAAALWGLLRSMSAAIHVSTPRRVRPPGLTVHRVSALGRGEWEIHDRIPVTTVARTLADCAETMPTREVVRLLEQAERLGLFDLRALRERPALAVALEQVTGDAPRVNSDWERDLIDFCDDNDIPRPALNVVVEGYVVDAFWPGRRVIVELDSWTFHRSRRAFVEDRRRVAVLQLAGYMVLPVTTLDAEAARLISAAVAAR